MKDYKVYELRVTLRDVSPPVWRRIRVWDDCTLDRLHLVLQVAMGWENCHLYEFRAAEKKYRVLDPEDEPEILDTRRARILRILPAEGATSEYLYDFGDGWQHDLKLEAIREPDATQACPHCFDGARACPPEDVGGGLGYEDYLAAILDPENEEHEQMLAWLGPFDPEAFFIEKVNRKLEREFRLSA